MTSPLPTQADWATALYQLADLFGPTGLGVRDCELVDGKLPIRVFPVVQHLAAALGQSDTRTHAACAALSKFGNALYWSRNPGYTDRAFLDGYAYCELLGPSGHWLNRTLALGLLLLHPRITYPEHAHPATETYVVLSGDAQWKQGDGLWRIRRPGEMIYHASMEVHAMRTGTQPLLAAYLWKDHLHTGARLVNPAPA